MPRPRSDIDGRIVAAARSRFLTEGVDGASLRSIAQDAGTNLGMIYYYFSTKDELFLAVVEDVYAKMLDDISQLLSEPGELAETVNRLFHLFARMSDVEFDVVRIIIREALVSSARLNSLVERFSRGHVPLVLGFVQRGLVDGSIDRSLPLPAVAAALAALAVMPNLLRRRLVSERPEIAPLVPDAETMASALARVALSGIGGKGRP